MLPDAAAIVDALLTHATCSPDLAHSDPERNTVLHTAARESRHDVVVRLLAARADASLRNTHGDTALHLAAKAGDVATAQAIVEASADARAALAAVDSDGNAPLHLAAALGSAALAQLFQEHGAPLALQNK